MRAEVCRVQSNDTMVSAEWEITVSRDWYAGSPPVADLPPDIRKALIEWLGCEDRP